MKLLNKNEFRIVVDVYLDTEERKIAASTIRSIYKDEEYTDIDDQGVADYEAFVEEVEGYFDDFDLLIVDNNESNKSLTSVYYTLADLNQWMHNLAKYVIFLRISDHVSRLTKEQKQNIQDHRNEFKKKYHVIYKVRNIVVNGEIFNSYDDASEYVRQKLAEYSEILRKSKNK